MNLVSSGVNAQQEEAASHWTDYKSETFLGSPTPKGFTPPFLDPTGVDLSTQKLADGVYALMSSNGIADNSGFVVGSNGVLVIDSHVNATMANKIMSAVAAVTSKPILYLVNTNYHGDHTFGNYAFPAETQVISHSETARQMRDIDKSKDWMSVAVHGKREVYEDVKLRLPDLTFERKLTIDLGGMFVEVHHFGGGNTSGDTVVYVPKSKVAWTGNLVVGRGTIPPMFDGQPQRYLDTIVKFKRTIVVHSVVPGHGRLATGEILDRYIAYLEALNVDLDHARGASMTTEEAMAAYPIERYINFPEGVPATSKIYLTSLHRLNVQRSINQSQQSDRDGALSSGASTQ